MTNEFFLSYPMWDGGEGIVVLNNNCPSNRWLYRSQLHATLVNVFLFYRGKCVVKDLSEVKNIAEYITKSNHFFYQHGYKPESR